MVRQMARASLWQKVKITLDMNMKEVFQAGILMGME